MKMHFYCDSTENVRNEERGHSPQKHRECSQPTHPKLEVRQPMLAPGYLTIHIQRIFTKQQNYYSYHQSNQAIDDI